MRAVLLSKALVHAAYRTKCAAIAAHPGTQLAAIVPPSWRAADGWDTALERDGDGTYELVTTPIAFNGRYHAHFYPRIGSLLRELRPDVFHVDEEPYNLATFHALWEAKRLGIPTAFFTLANIDRRLPPPFGLLERASFSWSRRAIAASEDAAGRLRARGYRGLMDVIPQFGVDTEAFYPATVHPDRVFTIGYVGRLVRAKGLNVLIRALTSLAGEWRLRIVGEGPLRGELEEQTEALGVAARVEFKRPVPSAGVPAVLRELDALVLPSLTTRRWKEQFGRILVEAMACGVPVVGSSSGEIPNVVGNAGVITPEGDARALATALAELMANAARREYLATAGRRRAVEEFSHRSIAARYHAVYEQLAREL